MTPISESRGNRQITEGSVGLRQLLAGVVDSHAADIIAHRTSLKTSKRLREVDRVNANLLRDGGQRQSLGEVVMNHLDHPADPPGPSRFAAKFGPEELAGYLKKQTLDNQPGRRSELKNSRYNRDPMGRSIPLSCAAEL
jgi:hypothetical protein